MKYTSTPNRALASRRAVTLVELLDIPDSYYERARDRYQSFADHLHRSTSSARKYNPNVSTQGSFRLGTVTRPLLVDEEYDLDMAVELRGLSKERFTQEQLKALLGVEVQAYATANAFKNGPVEKHRCWRLNYADEDLPFHMDIVPAVPEDQVTKRGIAAAIATAGNNERLADHAIAITDDRHPAYRKNTEDWPQSNPEGYAQWFEDRMRVAAELSLRTEGKLVFASVDQVPTWRWKTPLQRCVQLLKRHRDVMFRESPDLAPISIILTTLSARSYRGDADLYESLVGILDRMADYIQDDQPRIPNPSNPGEDFADRWSTYPKLETSFYRWHVQAKADFARLGEALSTTELRSLADKALRLRLNEEDARKLRGVVPVAAPVLIRSAPAPWAEQ